MESETWTDRITAWRAAPGAVRARARWGRIPRNVAESMAFELQAVPLRTLENWHAAQGGPDNSEPRESLQDPSDHPSLLARQVLALERQIQQAQFDTCPPTTNWYATCQGRGGGHQGLPPLTGGRGSIPKSSETFFGHLGSREAAPAGLGHDLRIGHGGSRDGAGVGTCFKRVAIGDLLKTALQ